jgi:hypothetical protein
MVGGVFPRLAHDEKTHACFRKTPIRNDFLSNHHMRCTEIRKFVKAMYLREAITIFLGTSFQGSSSALLGKGV